MQTYLLVVVNKSKILLHQRALGEKEIKTMVQQMSIFNLLHKFNRLFQLRRKS